MKPQPAFGLSVLKPRRNARLPRWARVLWASPNTLIGLALGLLLVPWGARMRVVQGVLEIAAQRQHPRRRLPFTAITLGHVIVDTHAQELERLRAHERVHVRQCERWGPLFLPAYLLAVAWQWFRGRQAYWDNPFEVEARRVGGCGSKISRHSVRTIFVGHKKLPRAGHSSQ